MAAQARVASFTQCQGMARRAHNGSDDNQKKDRELADSEMPVDCANDSKASKQREVLSQSQQQNRAQALNF